MKLKADAYEINDDSSLSKVLKCKKCSFHAVKQQFIDSNNCCPVCKEKRF